MFNLQMPTLADLMWLPGLIIGFTVHELGHALVAYWMGDRGDLTRERLTLNPVKHVSWLGLLVFVVFGFGWAKPVHFRPGAFKHTNLGSLLVSLAGVTANALLALVFFIMLLVIVFGGTIIAMILGVEEAFGRIISATEPLTLSSALIVSLTSKVVDVNIVLALFNLLPIPAFDGFHALLSLWHLATRHKLPDEVRQQTQALVAFEEGNRYAKSGKMPQAVDAWRKAVELLPQFYSAFYNLGLAYTQAGQRNAALGALANARLDAPGDTERQQVDELLKQVGWDSDEPPPYANATALPELAAAPLPLEEEQAANRRRAFKIVGITAGALVGLGAYTVLMTFLALLAAGM